MTEPGPSVEHLSVEDEVGAGHFQAVSDVSLVVPPGRVVGIVGKRGAGRAPSRSGLFLGRAAAVAVKVEDQRDGGARLDGVGRYTT